MVVALAKVPRRGGAPPGWRAAAPRLFFAFSWGGLTNPLLRLCFFLHGTMGVTLRGDAGQPVSKELFPCPLPFPGVGAFDHAAVKSCSRSVRSRLRSRLANQEWANGP